MRGLLLAAAHAQRHGNELIVPCGNAAEACAAAPAQVRAAAHLLEVCAHVSGAARCRHVARNHPARLPARALALAAPADLAEVRGQWQAKRALVIAAAGGHSLLLVGPPGCGKSMLARRLPGLLPPLTADEALEVAAVAAASAAGFRPGQLGERPFRAPHHGASAAALIGGGARARPGEISLAHHGVLFLDELPEFSRAVLEALREPLETGIVAVSRAALQAEYPAAFLLVAAMNPCPCGRAGRGERALRLHARAAAALPQSHFRPAARPARPARRAGARAGAASSPRPHGGREQRTGGSARGTGAHAAAGATGHLQRAPRRGRRAALVRTR